ncbi:MAG: hypothetical protein ACD_19C00410G0006 [uncultured bacterium]|nr:MAG: hypothetical protein ACD_19C00410G0006 [uncultured bacterium]
MNQPSRLSKLFPLDYKVHRLSKICFVTENILSSILKNKEVARIPGTCNNENYSSEINKFSTFPLKGSSSKRVVDKIIRHFFCGVPLWRSPNLQYNVGSPVNVVSSAVSAISQDINIYNINTGLSGNALAAEHAVSNILCDLADINRNKGMGVFTFGGTATNLYSMKIAINKSCPEVSKNGVSKNIKFLITEDAHFSHAVAANWLGIGTNNLVTIPATKNRTSDIKIAEKLMESIIQNGDIVSGVILNGGTTYDHTIDDILDFSHLIGGLVIKFNLSYRPHIHVDSVIGWSWLVFSGYDFDNNPLKIDLDTLNKIHVQYERISKLKYADSWGVDFHKGIGGCPVPCSVFMSNNKLDFLNISKNDELLIKTHQIATEFSFDSPSDFTLETSRSGAAPLAALAALNSLGKQGYRKYLAKLISSATSFKHKISNEIDIKIANITSLGFVTMLILIPPELNIFFGNKDFFEIIQESSVENIEKLNVYMKCFYKWDNQTRAEKKLTCIYSYSSSYIKSKDNISISALKFYPVSPHFSEKYVDQTIENLKKQKQIFDKNYWNNNKI